MQTSSRPSTTRVPAREAVEAARARGAAIVLDVRTPAEVAGEQVPGARCIPLDELGSRLDELRGRDGETLVLCRTGKRAERALAELSRGGIDGARAIDGGLAGWTRAGGETVRGAARMSLERQVRIAAGALVVVGVALGAFAHPGLLALPAFVGAGLVFAGATDWCGMGLLLAKMPWNRA